MNAITDPNAEAMEPLVALAALALDFGRVERVTRHQDGVRPETDTDHTVMLTLVTLQIAMRHRMPQRMDLGMLAMFALVHDLVEVDTGDVNTFDASEELKQAKAAKEAAGLERLKARLPGVQWVHGLLHRYGQQKEPAARLVRYVDKLLPRLTQALNGGVTFAEWGCTPEGVDASYERQEAELAAEYSEFAPCVGPLLEQARTLAVAAYRERLAAQSTEGTTA